MIKTKRETFLNILAKPGQHKLGAVMEIDGVEYIVVAEDKKVQSDGCVQFWLGKEHRAAERA